MPYHQYHSDLWLDIPYEEWMRVAVMKTGLGDSGQQHAQTLKQHMRSLIPVTGGEIIRDLQVIVREGENLKSHAHPQWTCIYYVYPGDPPVAIYVEGDRIEPEPGMFVVLHPHTEHRIETSKSEKCRLGFAMLVDGWDA